MFEVLDSGVREKFESGMQRDTADGKFRPDLVRDGPMLFRWMLHMTRGARKYEARNWMKAKGQEELERFFESEDRHHFVWHTWRRFGVNVEDPENPTTDPPKEDHAAGVFFNMNGIEYIFEQKEGVVWPKAT